MAKLKKITEGMANGCAAIDENFNALNDELSTSTSATLNIGNGLSIKFTKKGLGIVQAEFKGVLTAVKAGEEMRGSGSVWVSQNFCPPETISLAGHFAGGNDSFHIDIEPTGRVVWFGPVLSGSGATPRGTVLYFAK
ncbi:hypothetical protein EFO33_07395 [Lactococcus cremoris]|uniref:Receptor-binding protein of phage tail base-plate Siphoviridae head domain-containing protein n=1 Tax=Lactococcus lactis subsp. cremoris TaxID=1359 RepID=A0A8B6QK59_LACLC|nr:hypothetical protein [Lactococcus cremoris]MCT4400001.1 hypothetical protein [Lactococcus cremoris]MCT4428809.1 hypothetical protein [Lactococcus cremoris]QSD63184.1 hypothetical protein LL1196_1563 [Lactococcus cremoris]UXV62522.1 hypothetical protein LLUC047_07610 [Lactococcus cremoris]